MLSVELKALGHLEICDGIEDVLRYLRGAWWSYPLYSEAGPPGQDKPTSGDPRFLDNAPNMIFIVAPGERSYVK